MRGPLGLAALLSCLLATQALSQTAPTRMDIIAAVLQARHDYFGQAVIIDGCSLSTVVDSISSGIGTLPPKFSTLVHGVPGKCLERSSLPKGTPPRVLSFMVFAPAVGAEMAHPQMPLEEKARIFSVALVSQNTSNQTSHTEQWAVHQGTNGHVSVVGARISGIRTY